MKKEQYMEKAVELAIESVLTKNGGPFGCVIVKNGEIVGKGTRMGNTEMPKQFLMLGDKPIIIHTIEQFMINPKIRKVIVCCPKVWVSYANDLLKKYDIDNDRVEVTAGGVNRNESIMNGCK